MSTPSALQSQLAIQGMLRTKPIRPQQARQRGSRRIGFHRMLPVQDILPPRDEPVAVAARPAVEIATTEEIGHFPFPFAGHAGGKAITLALCRIAVHANTGVSDQMPPAHITMLDFHDRRDKAVPVAAIKAEINLRLRGEDLFQFFAIEPVERSAVPRERLSTGLFIQ